MKTEYIETKQGTLKVDELKHDDLFDMPNIKLSNGLIVANFSSPHKFEFEDGNILEKCTDQRAEKLKVIFNETKKTEKIRNIDIQNISLDFELSEAIIIQINNILRWNKNVSMFYEPIEMGGIEIHKFDVIIVPLSMLTAIKNSNYITEKMKKEALKIFKVIKMKSRTEKVVKIGEWCI